MTAFAKKHSHLRTDPQTLTLILEELAKIGRTQDGGITRRGFSREERAAHDLVAGFMDEAGLAVRVDRAGNTIGRLGGDAKAALVVGSHLDTVPDGGAFDGALGVAAGIAAAGALTQAGVGLPWALEIIAFVDEEGAHGAGTLGSRAMVGTLLPGETEAVVDGISNPLGPATEAVGLSVAGLTEAERPAADFVGYLELHIEQGLILERSGTQIGIVTGIPSIHRYQIEIHGRADHAGTTPVSLRDDALRKCLDFMSKLYEFLADSEGEMIGNLGNVVVQPGSFNVVPSAVTLALELRAADPERLAGIEAQCSGWLAEIDPAGTITTLTEKSGIATDGRLRDAIATAARSAGCSFQEMPSGAGHDATSFAGLVPAAMIFVPCREGKSHCADEFATRSAVVDGANTLLQTILNLGVII